MILLKVGYIASITKWLNIYLVTRNSFLFQARAAPPLMDEPRLLRDKEVMLE